MMAQATAIEWTDVSWNPVHGCSKVSPGCAKCYAETQSLRYGHTSKPWTPANAAENVLLKPHKLREPLSNAKPWDRPRRVFVNSMSDLFHELIPDDYICQVFAVMALAPQHTFQVLTKRPERMRDWFAGEGAGINRCGTVRNHVDWLLPKLRPARDPMARLFEWPLPNVWLGVSIENRRFVGRADALRETPAAVRFISAEPLLGPLIAAYLHGNDTKGWRWPDGYAGPELDLSGIDWLIVGGESGPGHRPVREEWVRDLRDACLAQGLGHIRPHPAGRTAFFFKQWGGATSKSGGRELDGRTWDEMPAVVAHA